MNLTLKLNGNTVSSIFINLKRMISHDISIYLDQLQDDISMLHILIVKHSIWYFVFNLFFRKFQILLSFRCICNKIRVDLIVVYSSRWRFYLSFPIFFFFWRNSTSNHRIPSDHINTLLIPIQTPSISIGSTNCSAI